jgi:hypothetical protein
MQNAATTVGTAKAKRAARVNKVPPHLFHHIAPHRLAMVKEPFQSHGAYRRLGVRASVP